MNKGSQYLGYLSCSLRANTANCLQADGLESSATWKIFNAFSRRSAQVEMRTRAHSAIAVFMPVGSDASIRAKACTSTCDLLSPLLFLLLMAIVGAMILSTQRVGRESAWAICYGPAILLTTETRLLPYNVLQLFRRSCSVEWKGCLLLQHVLAPLNEVRARGL